MLAPDETFDQTAEISVVTPAIRCQDCIPALTEIILLGCVALRVGEGRRMKWDGPNMLSPNLPEAAQFVKRNNWPGWDARPASGRVPGRGRISSSAWKAGPVSSKAGICNR
jgi:hypothetical protein